MVEHPIAGTVPNPYQKTASQRKGTFNYDALGLRVVPNFQFYVEGIPRASALHLIGASTAVGVGATADEFALPNLLSKTLRQNVLPAANRGATALEELMMAVLVRQYSQPTSAVILSGRNELYWQIRWLSAPSFLKVRQNTRLAGSAAGMRVGTVGRVARMQALFQKTHRWNFHDSNPLNLGHYSPSRPKGRGGVETPTDYVVSQALASLRLEIEALRLLLAGLPMWFVLQPSSVWISKTDSRFTHIPIDLSEEDRKIFSDAYVAYADGLKLVCETEGVSFLNLNLGNQGLKPEFFLDDCHFTNAGQLYLAETIAALGLS